MERKKILSVKITAVLLMFLLRLMPVNGLAAESTVSNPVSPSVKLEDLIQAAKERNPDVIAAKAEWLAARKRIIIDSSLEDPMAEYDIMGAMRETRTGPEKNRFAVSQSVPFPVKLWEKGKMAADEAHAAEARYKATERDVLNELRKLYYRLYEIDASLQALDEVKEVLKKAESLAQNRYSNLSGTQRDAAKAQAEVSMSLEKLFMLQHEREVTVSRVRALLDQDTLDELGPAEAPEKPVLRHSLIELLNLSIEKRDEIKEMEALVSKSRRAKRLAKWNFLPDVNIGFEYTQVGSGSTSDPSDGRDSWMFPLRVNLPLWFHRNIAEVQEAGKKLEASQARLRKTKAGTADQIKQAYHAFMSASKISELYETAVIPQAKLALSADQASYESGKGDFLNLLDSQRVYLNAKLSHVQIFTQMLKSYSDLVRAAGLDLEEKA